MAQLSKEDRAKQKELQGELGERAAFFNSPIGLIAIALPEQPAETYWKLRRDLRNDQLDKTGVLARFAVECVAYPEKNEVATCLRSRPALAVKLAHKARQLLGEGLNEDPTIDPEDHPKEAAILAELRAKYGDELGWFMVPEFGLLALAPPKSPACYRQFFAAVTGGGDIDPEVHNTFALDCVVHPSRDQVEAYLKLQPGLTRSLTTRGDGLCGSDFEELGKV